MPASGSTTSASPGASPDPAASGATAQPVLGGGVLADLPLWDCCVAADIKPQALEQHFAATIGLPGAVVMDGVRIVGMLSRRAYHFLMSKPYARELYFNKPIAWMTEIIDPAPLTLPEETPIYLAVAQVLDAPPPAFWRLDLTPLSLTDLRWNRRWTVRATGVDLRDLQP